MDILPDSNRSRERRNASGARWLAVLAAPLALACANKAEGSKVGRVSEGGGPGLVLGAGGAQGPASGGGGGATGSSSSGGAAFGPDAATALACGSSIQGLGACGAQAVTARVRHPHMLIVMDKSGSTTDQPTGFDVPIWDGMKSALATALEATRDRVWFGLQLYPLASDPSRQIPLDCTNDCCEMPTSTDMTVPVEDGITGVPKILAALEATEPGGGTPTAVALKRAYDYYTIGAGAALEGEKFVMLATDGGPNCNPDIQCEADGCTANLEGTCSSGINCCSNYGAACVDDQAVLGQIQALRDAGINTFVVGIPGSEAYSRYLDQFAVAGGQVNSNGPPSYYRVDASAGVAGLTSVFTSITIQLVTSCEIELDEPPRDPDKVNVAIDCEVIPSSGTDGTDGWILDATSVPSKVTLQGTLCRWVEQQGAERVDIVFGCQTIR